MSDTAPAPPKPSKPARWPRVLPAAATVPPVAGTLEAAAAKAASTQSRADLLAYLRLRRQA